MEHIYLINFMDTWTNGLFLFVVMAPIMAFILEYTMPEMPIIRSPAIKVAINGKLKIVTLRNPFTGKWLITFTMSNNLRPKPVTVHNIGPKGNSTLTYVGYGNPYRFAMGCLALLALAACEAPSKPDNADGTKHGIIVADHPKACIDYRLDITKPDTVIRYIESHTLKVSDHGRSRCSLDTLAGWVACKAKSPDTLYAIDRFCPSTLKDMGDQ